MHSYLYSAVPSPVVLVIPQNDSILPYAATNYSLVCKVDFNATYVNTGTAVMVEWTNSIGQLVTDSRITTSDTLTIVDGGYASTLTVSPLSLTDSGEFTCRATIQPDNTPAFVAASSPEEDTYTITVVGKTAWLSQPCIKCLFPFMCIHSSTYAKFDTISQWFWTCWRAPAAPMHLIVHTRTLQTTYCSSFQSTGY